MFGQGNREAPGAAAELPSGVSGVFEQHSVVDQGMVGQRKGIHFQLHGPGTSYDGRHLAAFLDVRLEGRTQNRTSCAPQTHVDAACYGVEQQHYGCQGPGFLLGFQVALSPHCGAALLDCH